jgi:hypothetical protein
VAPPGNQVANSEHKHRPTTERLFPTCPKRNRSAPVGHFVLASSTARTIATMPALIATGRSGHRSMMVAKSEPIESLSDTVSRCRFDYFSFFGLVSRMPLSGGPTSPKT